MSRKDEPLFLTNEPLAEGVPALRGMLWEAAVIGNSQGVLPSSLRERFDAALTKYAADCVAAYLASPETAKALARALHRLHNPDGAAECSAPMTKHGHEAAAILAAWRAQS